MKVVLRRSLPRCWRTRTNESRGLVHEADIRVSPHARLRAKLLVFESAAKLRRFWRVVLGKPVGGRTLGVVTAAASEVWNSRTGKTHLELDPRYFCVVGLARPHLSMEIVAHESVHAGFAYANRQKRDIFGDVFDNKEERIAYPAGAIAAGINRELHREGLYAE